MTFKHVKFEDSAVMRSLEKLAKEKKLVPSSTIKTASASVSDAFLSPTLMGNIITLCGRLRAAGFDKHAQDIEENFLAFKQAETLYETSKEKGEDLIDAAHPKGSHKLEGVDGDDLAVVETILDEQLKLLKIVDKNPTGKLSSNKNILGAVKVVLAQASSQLESLQNNLRNEINKVLSSMRKLDTLTSDELTISLSTGYLPNIEKLLESSKLDELKEAKKTITKLRWRLKPGTMFGLSEDTWAKVEPLQTRMEAAIDAAINLRSQIVQLEGKTNISDTAEPADKPAAPAVNPTLQKIQGAINSFSGLSVLVSSDNDPKFAKQKEDTLNWIKGVQSQLNNYKAEFSKLSPEDQQAQASDYDAAVNKLMVNYNTVHSDWV